MRRFDTQNDSRPCIASVLRSARLLDCDEEEAVVRKILREVQQEGDAAVLRYTRRFDSPTLDQLTVGEAEFSAAEESVAPETRAALEMAAANIRAYHEPLDPRGNRLEKPDGTVLEQRVMPLARVGVHVPGAGAAYPSTVLMSVIPAKVAGVPEVIVCTPPDRDGALTPEVLVAARLAGATAVYKCGGAQAVGAMAFGTATVPRVDKIVGPGNIYATLAKRQVFGFVDIESLAGPTEVVVVADESADARHVAADLIAQAEHGTDSLALLLTPSMPLIEATARELERQLDRLPRGGLARQSLATRGALIRTRDIAEAMELAAICAPEHLELIMAEPDAWIEPASRMAGAVMVGSWSSEPMGDYVAGPSHCLPTGGTARFASPLSVEDFVKRTTVVRYSEAGFRAEAPAAIRLAEVEGLEGHAAALRVRMEANE